MTGTAIGYAGSWGTAIAHASIHQQSLTLTCTDPGIGSQSVAAELSWNFPDAVTAGEPIPPERITLTYQTPSSTSEQAYSSGVRSVTEYGDAPVTVSAPQEDKYFPLRYSYTAKVPSSGPILSVLPVTISSYTLKHPGTAKFTLGTVTVHETMRDANGNAMPDGTFNATCTPDPALMQSFQINPAAPPSTHSSASTPTSAPTQSPRPSPKPTSPSTSPVDTSPATLPPSTVSATAPAPAPTPTTHLLADLTGKEVEVIGGTGLTIAGIGALVAALLVTRRRQ